MQNRSDQTAKKPSPRTRMTKEANRLTAKRIERLRKPGRYHDGYGLYLQITESGSRSWLLRYQIGGRQRMLGLGPLHTFSLKEARERAREARQKVKDDEDPIDARKAKRAAAKLEAAQSTTFKQAAERFLVAHEGAWASPTHRHQWRQTFADFAFPIFGDLPVTSINTDLVLKVLEPIWTAKMSTAKRLRGRIERVLDWAKARGLREGENPARWRGHLDKLLQKPPKGGSGKHHAAMPYSDLPAFVAELRAREGVAERALEVAVLTALRTSEVLRARWSEINLNERVWIIPAERMKANQEHKVPLSPRVVEILENLPREKGNEFVFIGARAPSLHKMALFVLLRDMRPGLTVHGFRSSFSDWAHEKTNTASDIIEMCLAHTVGSAVARAYRRTDLFDKRRALMEAWCAYCCGEEGTVIQFPSKAKEA